MTTNFRTELVKLKSQLISVYPKFSDVTLELYMGRTPYFETKDILGGFIVSYAIVGLRQAINGIQYEELTKKIENKN